MNPIGYKKGLHSHVLDCTGPKRGFLSSENQINSRDDLWIPRRSKNYYLNWMSGMNQTNWDAMPRNYGGYQNHPNSMRAEENWGAMLRSSDGCRNRCYLKKDVTLDGAPDGRPVHDLPDDEWWQRAQKDGYPDEIRYPTHCYWYSLWIHDQLHSGRKYRDHYCCYWHWILVFPDCRSSTYLLHEQDAVRYYLWFAIHNHRPVLRGSYRYRYYRQWLCHIHPTHVSDGLVRFVACLLMFHEKCGKHQKQCHETPSPIRGLMPPVYYRQKW